MSRPEIELNNLGPDAPTLEAVVSRACSSSGEWAVEAWRRPRLLPREGCIVAWSSTVWGR
jgi:hypothetical protein